MKVGEFYVTDENRRHTYSFPWHVRRYVAATGNIWSMTRLISRHRTRAAAEKRCAAENRKYQQHDLDTAGEVCIR